MVPGCSVSCRTLQVAEGVGAAGRLTAAAAAGRVHPARVPLPVHTVVVSKQRPVSQHMMFDEKLLQMCPALAAAVKRCKSARNQGYKYQNYYGISTPAGNRLLCCSGFGLKHIHSSIICGMTALKSDKRWV